MARKNNIVSLLFVFMIIIVIAIFFAGGYSISLGLPLDTGDKIIGVLPGMFIIIVSLLSIGIERDNPSAMGLLAVTGIGFALFIGELNTIGLLDSSTIGNYTIAQLQTLSVIAGLLLGGIAYATSRGR